MRQTDLMLRDFREWLDVYSLYFCGDRFSESTPWTAPRFSNDEIISEYLTLNPQHEPRREALVQWLIRRNPSRQLYLARAMDRLAGTLVAH